MASQTTFPVYQKERRQAMGGIKRLIKSMLAAVLRRVYDLSVHYAQNDLPRFANVPKDLCIELPRRITGAEYMHVGKNVHIGPGSLLVAQDSYPSPEMQNPDHPIETRQRMQPTVVIGDRVTATGGLTLSCMDRIVIEDDVLFAGNIIVMDNQHGFQNADQPYKYQPIRRIAPVVVGRGSWIAQNVVIMPGVSIGELSIIGANSVVTQSIPARCIAFGNPARVVKRWDEQSRTWIAAKREERREPR